MNNVSLTGRLTRDPELKFAAGTGKANCRFSIAVQRKFKNAEGKYEADFINCVAFGKTAETIAEYFYKGKEIAIIGEIRTGSYTAQDGTKRYTTDVFVNNFEFIGSNGGQQQQSDKPVSDDYKEFNNPVSDSDIPF